MSGSSKLFIRASGPRSWTPSLILALLLLNFGYRLFGAPNLYSGPDPYHQKWVVLPAFALLLVGFLAGMAFARRGFKGWELDVAAEEIQIKWMNGSLLSRRLRVESETRLPRESLSYLESQHGVILTGGGFHRDFILSKAQTQDLLAWLRGHGVVRFTVDGTAA